MNGLKFWDGSLYATSTARRTVLRIEIRDRRPAAITEVVSGLVGDDLAFDRAGTMYLAVHPDDQVVRIDRHGARTVLAGQADGLDGPTAVAVVDGGLVVTNLGLLGTRHRPSVMRLDTGVDRAALAVPHIA